MSFGEGVSKFGLKNPKFWGSKFYRTNFGCHPISNVFSLKIIYLSSYRFVIWLSSLLGDIGQSMLVFYEKSRLHHSRIGVHYALLLSRGQDSPL
jgi:hypothetical protein